MPIKTIQIDDIDTHARAKAKAAADGVSLKWVHTELLRGWVEGDFELTTGSPVRRQRAGRRDRAARRKRSTSR